MAQETITFDYSPLIQKLRFVPRDLQQPVLQAVKESGGNMIAGGARSLLQNTPPYNAKSRGLEAKRSGERAVKRDIAKVYASPSMVYKVVEAAHGTPAANAFYAQFMSGDTRSHDMARSLGFPVKPWDNGRAHHAARVGNRGRARDGMRYGLVSDYQALRDYRGKKVSHVGLWAASQMGGAVDLGGGSKIPAWVKRHPLNSAARWVVNERVVMVVMTFNPLFASDEVRRRMRYIREYAQASLMRRLPYILRAVIKARGLKLSAALTP